MAEPDAKTPIIRTQLFGSQRACLCSKQLRTDRAWCRIWCLRCTPRGIKTRPPSPTNRFRRRRSTQCHEDFVSHGGLVPWHFGCASRYLYDSCLASGILTLGMSFTKSYWHWTTECVHAADGLALIGPCDQDRGGTAEKDCTDLGSANLLLVGGIRSSGNRLVTTPLSQSLSRCCHA